MKINHTTNTPYPQFQAGLTKQMQAEINHCDPLKISSEFIKMGVPTDFKDNKVIAWCSLKCAEIINNINQKYKLGLTLPKGIFVEDFAELIDVAPDALATCNIARERLHPNSKKVTKEQTILINQPSYLPDFWERVDEIAEVNNVCGVSPTSHFLDTFIHEFCHSIHEGYMVNRMKFIPTLLAISETMDEAYLKKFHNKLGDCFAKGICEYAAESPMEAIACDMTKRIINTLDSNSLVPTQNFAKNSPYKISKPKTKDQLEIMLNRFWNGKFKL